MTFIAIDDKEWCKGIYKNGVLNFDGQLDNLDRTWKYVPFLDGKVTEFAHLYCQGCEMEKVCPELLQKDWTFYNNKLKAFVNSFQQARISLEDICIYDLLPSQFLLEFCDLKCQITDSVFNSFQKPKNYDFSLELEKILYKIRNQKLHLNTESLSDKRYNVKVRNLLKNIGAWRPYIDFNQFGTKTGRLTTKKNTFPILNLDSDFRSIIEPSNDFFLELDFNAAELRVLLALAGQEQPAEDLHNFNAERLHMDRADAKQEALAWLYGSSKVDGEKFNKFFTTDSVLEKFYTNNLVTNYYGREIEADSYHALNYIVQSSTSDMVLRQVVKLDNLLKNKRTRIGFVVHDSVVIDVDKNESELCNSIVDVFANNDFGIFPVRVRIGKNYGSLKEVKR